LKVLELYNKFYYDKNTRIVAKDDGYELLELPKANPLEEKITDAITVEITEDHKNLKSGKKGELPLQ
jgi:beta-xylosidase